MRKSIRNYTSDVPVSRSVYFIQEVLVKHNAKQIITEYDSGVISGIAFLIDTPKGTLPIKLPVRTKNVEAIFFAQKKPRRNWMNPEPLTQQEKEQAARTAWKNLYEWVDMQMTLLDMDQVRMEEIFLPYMATPSGKTFFEVMEDRGFLLPSGEQQ